MKVGVLETVAGEHSAPLAFQEVVKSIPDWAACSLRTKERYVTFASSYGCVDSKMPRFSSPLFSYLDEPYSPYW